MTSYVLDSSAILATVNVEPGYERVDSILSNSSVSTVNAAEVLSKLVERGIAPNDALEDLVRLGLKIKDFDISQAARAAELRPMTKKLGLSLGDRACIALAIQENAIAVTADKTWSKLDVCKIEIIR